MQREFLRARKVVLIAAVCFLAIIRPAGADPVGDFFKRIGNSIAHPQQKTPPRATAKKKKNGKPGIGQSPVPLTSPSPQAIVNAPPPQPTPPPAAAPNPSPVTVRAAGGVPRPSRRDMPYGVPVPGRPGFVTSPYAPSVGLVDVRNFPSGTEVKDPFTGKVFLTP